MRLVGGFFFPPFFLQMLNIQLVILSIELTEISRFSLIVNLEFPKLTIKK